MQSIDNTNYPYCFLLLYALTYMCNAVYNTFIPIYLDHVGFGHTVIGMLLALGPFVAIIAQPLWGMASDRSRVKNKILSVLLLGSGLSIALYPLSTNIFYLFFTIMVFTFFQTSVNPISDAITLESIDNTNYRFGPIRMAGTIGFSLMSVIAGILTKHNINIIFLLYFILCMLSFLSTFLIPKVNGHQYKSKHIPIWTLLKYKKFILLMLFSLIVQSTLGFYYSFFPIYFKQLGANNVLLGWSMFISAMSEIPFLFFADKILDKIGTESTLIASAIVISIRWLLLYFITNIYLILVVNMLHGFSFIVFSFSMAKYINSEIPNELKASGQAMNGLISLGLSRIVGSMLGGILSDLFGIKNVFLQSSIFAFATIAIFSIIFKKFNKHYISAR